MSGFAKVYATYGSIFIIMSLAWGWKFDGYRLDKWDIIGALIALLGACIIIYMPKKLNRYEQSYAAKSR